MKLISKKGDMNVSWHINRECEDKSTRFVIEVDAFPDASSGTDFLTINFSDYRHFTDKSDGCDSSVCQRDNIGLFISPKQATDMIVMLQAGLDKLG